MRTEQSDCDLTVSFYISSVVLTCNIIFCVTRAVIRQTALTKGRVGVPLPYMSIVNVHHIFSGHNTLRVKELIVVPLYAEVMIQNTPLPISVLEKKKFGFFHNR